MTQAVSSYAAVLLCLKVSPADVARTEQILDACPQLTEALDNPLVTEAERFAVIDRLFPASMTGFLKVVCRGGQADALHFILTEYHALERQQRHCAYGILEYVTPLTEKQLSAMRAMLCQKTGCPEAELELRQNPALLGGFVLHIGDQTYDRSVRRAMQQLRGNMLRR